MFLLKNWVLSIKTKSLPKHFYMQNQMISLETTSNSSSEAALRVKFFKTISVKFAIVGRILSKRTQLNVLFVLKMPNVLAVSNFHSTKAFGEETSPQIKSINAFLSHHVWEVSIQTIQFLWIARKGTQDLCVQCVLFMNMRSICDKDWMDAQNVRTKLKIIWESSLCCWFTSFTLGSQFSLIFESEKNQISQFWWRYSQTISKYCRLVFHSASNGLNSCSPCFNQSHL